MTVQMHTHPIHGDIVLDIDQISVIPVPENGSVILSFRFRENIRHEIELDKKTCRKLVNALLHSIEPDEIHPRVIGLD